MKTLKYFIGLASALALVTVAQAQVTPRTLSGTPTSIQTNTTWTTGTSSMNIHGLYPKSVYLGLQIDYKLSSTGDSNVVFTLQKSLDDSTFENVTTFLKAANGTNTVTIVTNLTTGAVGFWRIKQIDYIGSASDGYLTNLVVKWKGL